jgi:hypothetical protein
MAQHARRLHNLRRENLKSHHNILVGKLEGKRPLGRPKRRWDDNIKIELEEIGF